VKSLLHEPLADDPLELRIHPLLQYQGNFPILNRGFVPFSVA